MAGDEPPSLSSRVQFDQIGRDGLRAEKTEKLTGFLTNASFQLPASLKGSAIPVLAPIDVRKITRDMVYQHTVYTSESIHPIYVIITTIIWISVKYTRLAFKHEFESAG